MKTINILFIVTFLFIIACGTNSTITKPGTYFTEATPIILSPIAGDAPGIEAKLKNLLTNKGFNVGLHSKPKYEITISAYFYWDVFYWRFKSFIAEVTDLTSGNIVITTNFSGDKSVSSVLNNFVSELEKYKEVKTSFKSDIKTAPKIDVKLTPE